MRSEGVRKEVRQEATNQCLNGIYASVRVLRVEGEGRVFVQGVLCEARKGEVVGIDQQVLGTTLLAILHQVLAHTTAKRAHADKGQW